VSSVVAGSCVIFGLHFGFRAIINREPRGTWEFGWILYLEQAVGGEERVFSLFAVADQIAPVFQNREGYLRVGWLGQPSVDEGSLGIGPGVIAAGNWRAFRFACRRTLPLTGLQLRQVATGHGGQANRHE